MRQVRMLAALAVLAGAVVVAPGAQARQNCPPPSVGGRTVAWISVGDTRVPVKAISFKRGQALNPPDTNQAAGVSRGHAPLYARIGTTVITWHVRYGAGCGGTLNPVLDEPVGGTFTVRPVGKPAQLYRITSRHTVMKGDYRGAWFRQQGPHQLALFTCAGLRSGKFRKTTVILAERVTQDQATPPAQPESQTLESTSPPASQ
jgi:hypothetical protein